MWSEWRCWRQVSRQRTVFTPGHLDTVYSYRKLFLQVWTSDETYHSRLSCEEKVQVQVN